MIDQKKMLRRMVVNASFVPIVYHPDFRINPIPSDHRFPMPKDALLFDRISTPSLNLPYKAFTPSYPDIADLELVHDPTYVRNFLNGTLSDKEMRQIGLPWSQELVKRTLIGVGSAILATRLALQYGIVSMMCNGGTHHAHPSHGSGWCIFNDQAVAARAAQRDTDIKKVLFIDCDVHLGDGTAAIFEHGNKEIIDNADQNYLYLLTVDCSFLAAHF